jgi:hypothetical protein
VNTAVYLVFGVALIAFASWRILAGLHVLGLIEHRVPGHDIPDRYVPHLMKGDPEFGGLMDLLLGLAFAAAGVLCLVDAF